MGVELLNRSNATTKSKYPNSIKIVHFEGPKFSYAFLRKFLAFLRKFLAFLRILTRCFSAVNRGFERLWFSYAFLRVFLAFLRKFWAFSSFLCCLVRHLAVIELLFAVKKMRSERCVGDLIFFFAFFGQASISTKAIRFWKGNHSEIVSPDPLGLVWAARPAQKLEILAAKV